MSENDVEIEHHTGTELRLSKRLTPTSVIESKTKNHKRLKLSLMSNLTDKTELALTKVPYVLFCLLYRPIHTSPRQDARGLRYCGYAITDLRGHEALLLVYHSALRLLEANKSRNVLWGILSPRLIPIESPHPSEEDGEEKVWRRRTFVVEREEQLFRVGRVFDFSVCLGTNRSGVACTQPVDRHQQGKFCTYHKERAEKERKIAEDGGEYYVQREEDTTAGSTKTLESQTKNEDCLRSEENNVSALERRRKRQIGRTRIEERQIKHLKSFQTQKIFTSKEVCTRLQNVSPTTSPSVIKELLSALQDVNTKEDAAEGDGADWTSALRHVREVCPSADVASSAFILQRKLSRRKSTEEEPTTKKPVEASVVE